MGRSRRPQAHQLHQLPGWPIPQVSPHGDVSNTPTDLRCRNLVVGLTAILRLVPRVSATGGLRNDSHVALR